MIVTETAPEKSRIQLLLEKDLQKVLNDEKLKSHSFLNYWTDNTERPVPIEKIYQFCQSVENPTSIFTSARIAATRAAIAGQCLKDSDSAIHNLAIDFILYGAERWLSNKISDVATNAEDKITLIKFSSNLISSIAAAVVLNLPVRLVTSRDDCQQAEVFNEISDIKPSSYGHEGVGDALKLELSRHMDRKMFTNSSSEINARMHDDDIRDHLSRYESRFGVRPIVNLDFSQYGEVIPYALANSLMADFGIGIFYRQNIDGLPSSDTNPAIINELKNIQNTLETRINSLYIDNQHPATAERELTQPSAKHSEIPHLFICYARDDEKSMRESQEYIACITKALDGFKRHNKLTYWIDKQIEPGKRWKSEILTELEKCDGALLLISPAFIDSEFIKETELPALSKRENDNKIIIIPIVIRLCEWDIMKLIEPMQVMFANEGLSPNQTDRDKQVKEITGKIRKLFKMDDKKS